MENIIVVIVTYNRKHLLKRCLDAVALQTYKPHLIYIIDNASTDGTKDYLYKEGFLKGPLNGMTICYEQLPKNIGGAGGFYTGIKLAHEAGCDGVWVMDDDGVPDKDCLKNLVEHMDKYDYLSPLVVDVENKDVTSFMGCTVSEFLKREKDGMVEGCANPFNGILYSKGLIDAVGYPKKEMFIWGDEINYDLRAREKGFVPVVVVDAIHQHPLNRQMTVKYWRNRSMTTSNSDWKLFCYVRNRTYNSKKFSGVLSCLKLMASDFLKFFCYYGLKTYEWKKVGLIIKAMRKGFNEDFSGLDKYMN